MKKYIIILITLFTVVTNVTAQVNLTLAFNSRPLPYVADWNKSVNGFAILTTQGGATGPTEVKIKAILTNEEGVNIATTNVAAAPIINLNALPATNRFTLGDIIQLQNMQFVPAAQNLLQHSGRLKAGTYRITVQILSTQGSLLTEKIGIISCTGYQLPVPIFPNNGAVLNASVASSIITFRWTRLTPVLQELPRYRIQVFEVYNHQTPMQALRSNMPLVDEEAQKGTTQYIWRTNLSMIDSSIHRKFIWTIQTLDFNGAPVPTIDMNQQGRSEPSIFTIETPRVLESRKKSQWIMEGQSTVDYGSLIKL